MGIPSSNQPFAGHSMQNQTISVVGLGYIGLPTAAVLSQKGHRVVGVDVNPLTVQTINQGKIHIVEPELESLVSESVQTGLLRATTTPEPADVFLFAVPTPLGEKNEPDLTYLQLAMQSIAPVLKAGDLLIIESTSPVGTTELAGQWLKSLRPDLLLPSSDEPNPSVHLAYCPERALPGKLLHEITANDRVIGGMTPSCAQAAAEVYSLFVTGKIHLTDVRTAELCKLTENSFRDVNVAFANELSMVCERLDVNVWELIRLANRHPRVNILQPGPGVGGHCIAVDPWFIVHSAPNEARLIQAARRVNDEKTRWALQRIKHAVEDLLAVYPEKSPQDVRLACFGLSFKANIDDLRESPAMEIVEALTQTHMGPLWVVEPNLQQLPPNLADHAVLKETQEAFNQADLRVLLVDHDPFKVLGCVPGPYLDFKGIWRN